MSFTILSMGTALPATVVPQQVASCLARRLCCRTDEQATWLPLMYDHSGITTRHQVLGEDIVRDVLEGTRYSGSVFLPSGEPDDRGPTTSQRMRHYAEMAPPLAVEAARAALEGSGLPARSLTHLVTVSCTGFRAPGIDLALIRGLDLAPTIQRTHVGFMGCHGALNGLRVARAFTTAEPHSRVLVCAVELCVLHYFYGWDPQRVIANALFADGAAAVIGSGHSAGAWQLAASGSCLLPDSEDAMTWSIGDHGFDMTLSRGVLALIRRHLRPWLEGWLLEQGVGLADVSSWAIHPGGPRIVDTVQEQLGLSAADTAASRAVLAECGNMSSPTLLFILDRLRRGGAPRPCVALGFGPGLVVEAALFR
jgi:predicted naringenin-chalcone synthase